MRSDQIGAGCLALVVMMPIAIAVRGAVLSQLWAWFVVPLGVVAITLPWALGISLIAWFLTDHTSNQYEGKSMSDIVTTVAASALGGPLIALGMGWLYHGWMS